MPSHTFQRRQILATCFQILSARTSFVLQIQYSLPMSTYAALAQTLRQQGVTLVAVSKTRPVWQLMPLYEQGQRIFAENRVQELVTKQAEMPPDVVWHLIGHLQKNKVKYIAPFVQMIHSVDSLELLQEIDKQAGRVGRVIDCLLQFHIAQEDTKFGLTEATAMALLDSPVYATLRHVRVCGVMGMASFTDDTTQVQAEFAVLRGFFERIKAHYFAAQPHFCEISMGMSSDWEVAVAAGSTMVRIGSLLFEA